ncbi:hypothetical protein [Streptomyces sp. MP131-18]|uniref:hypothetical protein n=1 Tax=Streptomyces sp. MP131-18 TaxID=1857892 RepID=UPI00097C8169|nr:hypothetical protein [Streptomyces sp. MP131-18]ONK13154.1 hypothetical protein STBA_39160 [Streptomyces sp. MP131-18]
MALKRIALHPDREVWERQPGESAKAFGRFSLFLDTTPSQRSYSEIAASYGCSVSVIQKQAAVHLWQERVAAYDAERSRQRRERIRERDEELCRILMDLARATSTLVARTIQHIAETREPLDAHIVPRWVEAIERMRRIALDQPDKVLMEVTGKDGGPIEISEFEGLSEEEKRLRAQEMAEGVLRLYQGGKSG